MGQHITKQPNGKYAIFSSVVDHFIAYDATPEDIRDHFRKEAIERAYRQTSSRAMECAEVFDESRFQLDLETVATIHGQPESDKYRKMLSQGASADAPPQADK